MSANEINPISMLELCVVGSDEEKETDSDVEIIEDTSTDKDDINWEIREAVAAILNVDKGVEQTRKDHEIPTLDPIDVQAQSDNQTSNNEEYINESETATDLLIPATDIGENDLQPRVDQVFSYPHAPLFDLMEERAQPDKVPDKIVDVNKRKLVLSKEEKHFRKKFIKENPEISKFRLHCTVCDVHLGTAGMNHIRIKQHRLLRVLQCTKCHDNRYSKTEKNWCIWCFTLLAKGVNQMKCSQCPASCCKVCIIRNFGADFHQDIAAKGDWKCFLCNPRPIWPHRVICWALLRHIQQVRINEFTEPEKFLIDWTDCCRNNPTAGIPSSSKLKFKPLLSKPATNESVNLQAYTLVDPNSNYPKQVFLQTNTAVSPQKSIVVQSGSGSFQFDPDENHMFVQGNQPWTLNTGPQIIHNVYPQKKVVLIPVPTSSVQRISGINENTQKVISLSVPKATRNIVLNNKNNTNVKQFKRGNQVVYTYNDKDKTFINISDTSGNHQVFQINGTSEVPYSRATSNNVHSVNQPVTSFPPNKGRFIRLSNQPSSSSHTVYKQPRRLDLMSDHNYFSKLIQNESSSQSNNNRCIRGVIRNGILSLPENEATNTHSTVNKPTATVVESVNKNVNPSILKSMLVHPSENNQANVDLSNDNIEDDVIFIDDEPGASETSLKSVMGKNNIQGINIAQLIQENFQSMVNSSETTKVVEDNVEAPRPRIKIKAIEDLIDKRVLFTKVDTVEENLVKNCSIGPEKDSVNKKSLNQEIDSRRKVDKEVVDAKCLKRSIDSITIPDEDVKEDSLKSTIDSITISDEEVVNMKSLKRAIDGMQRVLISVVKSVRESRSTIKGFPNLQCTSDTAASLVSSVQTDLKMCVRQLNVIQSNVYEYYKNVPGIIQPLGLADSETNTPKKSNDVEGVQKSNYMDNFTKFLTHYQKEETSNDLERDEDLQLNTIHGESNLTSKRPRLEFDTSKKCNSFGNPIVSEDDLKNIYVTTNLNSEEKSKEKIQVKCDKSKYHTLFKRYNIKECSVYLHKLDPALMRVYENT